MALAFSVNTNPGALTALKALNSTNQSLSVTQNRINTGFKVAGAADGAAIFAIAQNLRADVSGLGAVQQSLDRSISVVDVALNAAETISDLLVSLRDKAVAASDPGLDSASRSALEDEFQQIRAQIDSTVASADFNGTNLIKASPDSVSAINANGSTVFTITGTDLGAATLGVASAFATATAAASAVTTIDTAVTSVNSALSTLGSGQNRLQLQRDFTVNLRDSLEVGIGNLVDADLARESASLQALQVKQQLGLQALGIANQAPSSVLALFR